MNDYPNEKTGIRMKALFGAAMVYIVFIAVGLVAYGVVAVSTSQTTTTISQTVTNATTTALIQSTTGPEGGAYWPVSLTIGVWAVWLAIATALAAGTFISIQGSRRY